MSRVYWHSLSEPDAELRGSERAYLGGLADRIGLGVLRMYGWADSDSPLYTIVDPKHYAYTRRTDDNLDMYFRSVMSDGPYVDIDGRTVDVGYAIMNTAIQIGSPQLGLAARIHGNCENHLWVDGPNRAWLADIMQRGRDIRMYRDDAGWESVIELLLKRDDEPVVTSYSVTDQFPNINVAREFAETPKPTAAQWEEHGEDARYMAFEELPEAEQWDWCMKALRARGHHYELRPDTWYDTHYDHIGGRDKIYTAFDVLEEAQRRHHEQYPDRYAGWKPAAKSGVDNAPSP